MRQRTGTPFPPMCSVQMIASGQYTEGHRWAPARVRAHHRRERPAFFASASARACAPPTASLTLRGTPKCLARASNVVRLERAREGRSRALREAAGPPRATRGWARAPLPPPSRLLSPPGASLSLSAAMSSLSMAMAPRGGGGRGAAGAARGEGARREWRLHIYSNTCDARALSCLSFVSRRRARASARPLGLWACEGRWSATVSS